MGGTGAVFGVGTEGDHAIGTIRGDSWEWDGGLSVLIRRKRAHEFVAGVAQVDLVDCRRVIPRFDAWDRMRDEVRWNGCGRMRSDGTEELILTAKSVFLVL